MLTTLKFEIFLKMVLSGYLDIGSKVFQSF